MDEKAQKLKRARSLVGTSEGRPEGDFYPTPTWVTKALLTKTTLHGLTLEPACGDGAMSKVLVDHGLDVISTDLVYRGYGEQEPLDFLTFDPQGLRVRNVVTNPPYSLALDFVEKAFTIADAKVCMFLKLAFLEGQERWRRLEGHYPDNVYAFTKRPQLTREGKPMKNGGMIAFAWYVWDYPFTATHSKLTHIFYDQDAA